MASAGMEGVVRLWDIQNENSQMKYENLGGVPWTMQWNPQGTTLGLITKEKKMHLLDPRKVDSAMVT